MTRVLIIREPVFWRSAGQEAHCIYPATGPRTPDRKLGENLGSIEDREQIEAATVALARRLGYDVVAVAEPLELPGMAEVW